MDLQAADLFGSGLGQPGQHSTGRVGLHDLLRGPKAVCRCRCTDPHHLVRGQAQLGQATGMRLLRWCDQVNAATGLDKGRQRWPQQSPLTQRCLRHQQLGQAVCGPATSRQLLIQRREARRHRARDRSPHLRAPPDSLRHMAWKDTSVEGAWGRRGGGWHKNR